MKDAHKLNKKHRRILYALMVFFVSMVIGWTLLEPSNTKNKEQIESNMLKSNVATLPAGSENARYKSQTNMSDKSETVKKIDRKSASDSQLEYLQSIIGDFDRLPEDEELEKIEGGVVHIGWMVDVKRKFKNSISDKKYNAIREIHIKALNGRNLLLKEYTSQAIDWQEYIEGMKSLAEWSTVAHQKILTEKEYATLFSVSEEETQGVIDGIFTPPHESEVLILFPRINANNPNITTDEDLYQIVDQNKINELVELKKNMLAEEIDSTLALNAGKISLDEMRDLHREKNNFFLEEVHRILDVEEFQVIFGNNAENISSEQ